MWRTRGSLLASGAIVVDDAASFALAWRRKRRGRDPSNAVAVELATVSAVAVTTISATRDLGSRWGSASKLLVAESTWRRRSKLLALLRRLKETERAEDAVAGLDQVESPSNPDSFSSFGMRVSLTLAGQLGRAIGVSTAVVAANDRGRLMLLLLRSDGKPIDMAQAR